MSLSRLSVARIAVQSVYTEVKSFFGSPIFFVILGCSFLLAAYRLIENTHPSFVFLLAILGISIVLYGTGTHGVGSADFKNVPVRVAVAGGAGVLAAVFGFGIVWQGEKIPEIFKAQRKYGIIRLANGDKHYDFSKLFISATSFDGTPLHLMTRANLVQIVMPMTVFTTNLDVCVLVFDPSGKRLTEPDLCLVVALKEHDESDNNDARDRSSEKKGEESKDKAVRKRASTERRDFERIYEGILTLNPDAIPKEGGLVFYAQ
jgi:hypothetical protein